MTEKLAVFYAIAWRSLIALFTVEIATVSVLRYLTEHMPPPPPIVENAFAHPFLILHVVGGVTALLLGPLQFVRFVRTRWPGFHRVTGRLYVIACAIGAPAGFMLALGTTAGPVAVVGFAIPALLWPVFTGLGWRAAVERRFGDHREWMLRSYAITATAITLRLMLPASALLGYPFYPAYRVIAWLGWITNLAFVEFYIRRARHASGERAATTFVAVT
ncbi:MAG: DUF2306 domain-containing protein [Sphingomonas sp.]|uniref:DUF2306 domain-containing protein n=1 Tax=Sphingomonas sp. TaxID=28214 RepID=UPI001211E318|nr:DUF2306 domain-containing protein [Sphingomonas sp.]THD35144.1 MAG: DUF2306 domain-containing protein [Sphingomonas sp.]